MNDTAVVPIKPGAEIGLALLNGPEDADSAAQPEIVLPARGILRLMLEMPEAKEQLIRDMPRLKEGLAEFNPPRHYVLYAQLGGRWYPIERLAHAPNGGPDLLLWRLASPDWAAFADNGHHVVVKLDPTPEYVWELAQRHDAAATVLLDWVRGMTDTLDFKDAKLVRLIGLQLGVRLREIEWVDPTRGRKEPRLRFVCDHGTAEVPLRSVRGQTSVFRGGIAGHAREVPRKVPRGDWDLILAVLGVIVGHDVLGDEGWARVRAAAAKAATTTPVV